MIAIYDSIDQPMQNLVVDSNKMRPSYPLGIPATPKAYSLTPPPTVEHPKRYWHTGDTDVDESDSNSGALQRHVYLMASQLSLKCFHFFNTALHV